MAAVITEKLLLKAAYERLLNPRYEEHRHPNPVEVAIALDRRRVSNELITTYVVVTLGALALLVLSILFYADWSGLVFALPQELRTGHVTMGSVGVGIPIALVFAGCFSIASAIRAYSQRELPVTPHPRFLHEFLADLNDFFTLHCVERSCLANEANAWEFLTASEREVVEVLAPSAGELVVHAAEIVVSYQQQYPTDRTSAVLRDEGELRAEVERRYDTYKRIGLLPPGGVAPYYKEAESRCVPRSGGIEDSST